MGQRHLKDKEEKAMEIMKWEPFRELSSLRQEMNRLFDSFFDRERPAFKERQWVPAIDVSETPEEIKVKAELPGIDEKDISLSLSGNNLMIKGERKEEKEEKDKHFHRIERAYGAFQRVISLPVSIEADKIKAEYKKGVLEIHLPKKAEAVPKKIPINIK
jgi:HSP20 family protein